jgi:hypothetical protein
MRDHPLGVGWNNATKIYVEKYSPPEGGPGAITTNDYLMLGTELGIPAVLCFVAYVGLCYRKSPRIQKLEVRSQELVSVVLSRSHLTSRADLEFGRGTSSGLRPPSPQSGEGTFPIGTADAERGKCAFATTEVVSPDICHALHLRKQESVRAACLAGALVLLVAFWFDGGLFQLPTAALFWVLLELGAMRGQKMDDR